MTHEGEKSEMTRTDNPANCISGHQRRIFTVAMSNSVVEQINERCLLACQ